MKSTKSAFTLVELLVVLGIVAMIMAAFTSSMASAQQRAKISRATSEVKLISQAILSYENYNQDNELPSMSNQDADQGSIGLLIGNGGSSKSGKIPALLMAQLSSGGKMLDPWGTPYKISIKPGNANVKLTSASGTMQTGYYLPNFFRLSAEERK